MKTKPIELFEAIAADLYGKHWQGDLARALGIPPRTLHHWRAKREVPAEWWPRLRDLCAKKVERMRLAQQATGAMIGMIGG